MTTIDSLRTELNHLNRDIAQMTGNPPVSLSQKAGDAEADRLFVYGILGGKDVGKTTLINQLAGSRISLDSDLLDEGTRTAVAYCHRQNLPDLKKRFGRELENRVRFAAHEEMPLLNMVLVDLPDFDSRFLAHESDTRQMCRHLEGLVWVTTPRKYGDDEFVTQLETVAQSHENYYVVVNKMDQMDGRVSAAAFRKEVIRFLEAECRGRNVPPPRTEHYFFVSALDPDAFDFKHIHDRLIRPHSSREVTRAKLANVGAEFDKNLGRMKTHYQLQTRLADLDGAIDLIHAQVAEQFSEDYFTSISRKLTALESIQHRINRAVFTQRVKQWPILRWLFYPLAGIIVGFGRRFAGRAADPQPADAPRDLLRYKGVPASMRMLTIHDKVRRAFPDLKQVMGRAGDFGPWVDERFAQLLGEYEDQVTERLLQTHARPSLLKRILLFLPLIWFPLIQPVLLKWIQDPAGFSGASLNDLLVVLLSLAGAGALLTNLVFLLLFYTLWLVLIYAKSARTVQKSGEDIFRDLWHNQFLACLADTLGRPLLTARDASMDKISRLEAVEGAVKAEIERLGPPVVNS